MTYQQCDALIRSIECEYDTCECFKWSRRRTWDEIHSNFSCCNNRKLSRCPTLICSILGKRSSRVVCQASNIQNILHVFSFSSLSCTKRNIENVLCLVPQVNVEQFWSTNVHQQTIIPLRIHRQSRAYNSFSLSLSFWIVGRGQRSPLQATKETRILR